ncbi:MAG: DUF1697 domain-containing protein [Vicinamibacterales bacterium]
MPRYVAFLRAVNVGGRVVKMDELRAHFAAAGFTNVETFIASGNVVFDTPAKAGPALEAKIETALKKALGYDVPAFVRTLAEVQTAAERQPFSTKAVAGAGAFLVGLLKPPVDPGAEKRLNALDPSVHTFKVVGAELYWLCTLRQSETTLTPGKIEKALGGPTTMRAMTSIGKLAAKYCKG